MGCCDTPDLMPINQALDIILAATTPLPTTQIVTLEQSVGYVLAQDLLSPLNVPPFANSAMDGYAVRCSDLQTSPCLPVAGKSFAGQPFNGNWPANSCIRIMTGAQIPLGCNAVIMQEHAQADGDSIDFSAALPLKAEQNIRPIGDDIQQSDPVLTQGHRITARDVAMIASLGIAELTVFTQPKVAFFSTGDELKPLGSKLQAGEIYDSNRYGIKALLEKLGCQTIDLGVIPDDKTQLELALIKAQQLADVVVTSGGVSVGEADYTKEILQQQGEIGFWKLAIKPGKPFAFGQLGKDPEHSTLFCGLPGNPVSAFVTLYVLVQPMLAKLAGHTQWQQPASIPAISKNSFKKTPGRTDYQRGIYHINAQGQFEVSSTGNQSSGAFRSMSLANCFIVLEQQRGQVEAGEIVTIQPFASCLN